MIHLLMAEADLSDLLKIGLQLTVYGTGLVFLVLAFLWGLMSLLLRLDAAPTPDTKTPQAPEDAEPASLSESTLSPQEKAAAVLAVLLHIQQVQSTTTLGGSSSLKVSSPSRWVSLGRARQLVSWHRRRGDA